MANGRPRTLPKIERIDSRENKVTILSIDNESRTIYAQTNGCNITAVCRERDNPDIYDRIKGILISSLLD